MFGNNGNQMEQMVKKHNWDKIEKRLQGSSAQLRLELATACGNSSDASASNFLINLLRDNDENVQIQAVKSLGMIKSENAKTSIRMLFEQLPEGKSTLREAIRESIAMINKTK